MSKTHNNSSDNKGIQYGSSSTPDTSISDRRDSFILDKEFILTKNKTLKIGMPYMLLEGNRTAAVRLVKTWVEDNIIYLDVEELNSPRTFCLSWNLDYNGSYWLWSLADLSTLFEQED